MKTWKHFTFVAILAIVGIVVGFIACDDGNGENDPALCACNPKEHYLPCDCGGTDCTCDVIPRGYILEYQTNVPIPIYQGVGVTDTQAEIAKNNIITAWNSNDGLRIALKGKITNTIIVIVAGRAYSADKNSGIIEIGADYNSGEIGSFFQYVVIPAFNDE